MDQNQIKAGCKSSRLTVFVSLNSFLLYFILLPSCIHNKGDQVNTTLDDISGKHSVHYKGAVVRTDTTRKNISLVFTAHEFAEGYITVKQALDKYLIKASFFFTGDFYRNTEFAFLIHELENDGHYLGAHSDKHLLYASWDNRDSLLVTKKEFTEDLAANYREMEKFGIPKDSALLFLPPFEWYNDSISQWCREMGIILVNFTPGTIANHDWTFPEPGGLYYSSDSIYSNILNYERDKNLNGFILLLHLGTDPGRPDKFYHKLDNLLEELIRRGYHFTRIYDAI